MDDEFKLCWKNFQDNIASGFQNLYDRGDLVDVTLACDGKLLQAHKIVLAICSPYFQEIFTTNPCQHPIIILKDVSFNIMCELLEFMYQGVVNVKHTELQSFMKIGQLLQIKGLATNSNSPHSGGGSSGASEKSAGQVTNAGGGDELNNSSNSSIQNNTSGKADGNDAKSSMPSNSRTPNASPSGCRGGGGSSVGDVNHLYMQSKRSAPTEFNSDSLSIYSRKQLRRSSAGTGESGDNPDGGSSGMDNPLNPEEFFLPPIPHISMVESRYDLGSLKRDNEVGGLHHSAAGSGGGSGASSSATAAATVGTLRNPFAPAFNLDYNNFYKATGNSGGPSSSSGGSNNLPGVVGIGLGLGNSSSNNNSNNNGSNSSNSLGGGGGNLVGPATEYPNELYMPSDYSKNFANHMDIPANGTNMVMLSTTSLLHGNCVFNRNNTVATQQGMKTYWLCKSYRISMCRARCITHLGRIISATGVHNHMPHMRGGNGAGNGNGNGNLPPTTTTNSSSNSSNTGQTVTPNPNPGQTNYSSISDGNGLEMNHATAGNSSGSSGRLGVNIFGNQTTPASSPGGHHSGSHHHPHHHPPHHHHPHHHHLTQSMPNLLVQHHTSSQHTSIDQHGMSTGPPPATLPAAVSNSVIQNIMHNPNLMHLPMQPQTHPHPHHQQQQHSPHSHLELGASGASLLPLSPPPHMQQQQQQQQQQSPQSNRSSHSMHATESPLGMKSPPPQPTAPASHEDAEQHVDINASADGSAESAAGTAHVIDSITISPGSGHNFKIENI
ncbi:broad-complex core protein isoforms 1/2/3/4/5 isoform X1 [Drosophila grimshawi]|uniref:GH22212 n=1 Tax=Drosophila grimshawi TaxID=7222 RepID=B4JSA6_DROGR|nr:broad-complex core protein isoforms 1/2/3/4/5 isoform X1 [Drosophila grimshawi]EDV94646.1 GH22212 [Drosophila grimshawi]